MPVLFLIQAPPIWDMMISLLVLHHPRLPRQLEARTAKGNLEHRFLIHIFLESFMQALINLKTIKFYFTKLAANA
jgi:hypothetical protein